MQKSEQKGKPGLSATAVWFNGLKSGRLSPR